MEGEDVVGGWIEIKRMKTRETCFYMRFASLTKYTYQKSRNCETYSKLKIIQLSAHLK